jgi:RNA polymerase sporulation-specific sigma factor
VGKSLKRDDKILALLERVREGDELAFEQLNEKYRTVVESATASAVRSMERSGSSAGAESAEDLKQEASLALYRAAKSYDPEGDGKAVTFGLYAKICVKNALISELRRLGAAKRRADRAARRMESNIEKASRDNTLSVVSRMRLESLTKESRRVLSGYEQNVLSEYMSGKTVAEISDELNKSQKSVNNALYRIRTKLRNLAQEPDAKF